jgi:23S rRNA pseudouridine2457 synthase
MQGNMLIRFYKPYGVMSQFRDPERAALGDYIPIPGVYPAGRLDRDSEGLVLLTDDGNLQARISHPRFKQPKYYQVLVEACPAPEELADAAARCREGVPLRDGLARARLLRAIPPPQLPARDPPVTPHRENRGSWIEIVLTEGRNRQVRRMLAAVGLPVLRLHRSRIGPVDLAGLAPGAWESIEVPPMWRAAAGSGREGDRGREGNRGRSGHVRKRRGSPPASR